MCHVGFVAALSQVYLLCILRTEYGLRWWWIPLAHCNYWHSFYKLYLLYSHQNCMHGLELIKDKCRVTLQQWEWNLTLGFSFLFCLCRGSVPLDLVLHCSWPCLVRHQMTPCWTKCLLWVMPPVRPRTRWSVTARDGGLSRHAGWCSPTLITLLPMHHLNCSPIIIQLDLNSVSWNSASCVWINLLCEKN